jgi:protein tyrosine/serine phosphatase
MPASKIAKRQIMMSGIHNFRDYGGYPTSNGGRVVTGRLYRSGDHSNASKEDLVKIVGLNISDVIDLRGSSERRSAPCRRPSNFNINIHFAEGETAALAPHVEAASTSRGAHEIQKEMISRYANIPFRPYLIDVYRQYFHAIANANGGTVLYCSAGKDRTGVLVALIQHLLGVHSDDIMADYLLTNTAKGQKERTAVLRADLEKRFGAGLSEEAINVITGVQPEFLEAALKSIEQQSGCVDSYIRDVLEVTPDLRRRIFFQLIA